jgi:hypothetical protein
MLAGVVTDEYQQPGHTLEETARLIVAQVSGDFPHYEYRYHFEDGPPRYSVDYRWR